MKKILTAIILSSLLLSGCGSRNSSDSSSSSEKAESATAVETTEAAEPVLEFRMGETKDGELILTEKDIEKASVQLLQSDDRSDYVINVKFNSSGSNTFEAATSKAAENNQAISIWYKGEMLCSPEVTTAITNGSAIISGNFDLNKAQEIAEKICPPEKNDDQNNDNYEGE